MSHVPQKNLYKASWLRKMLCYQAIAKGALNSYLGIPKLYVLALMTTEETKANLLKSMTKIYPDGTELLAVAAAKPIHAFGIIPEPDDHYFTADWQRVNHPPLNLSRIGTTHAETRNR